MFEDSVNSSLVEGKKILESINKELNIVKIGIKTKSTTTLVF